MYINNPNRILTNKLQVKNIEKTCIRMAKIRKTDNISCW